MEVGEYIRTDKGKIGKVIRIREFSNGRYDRPHYLIDWNNGKSYFMSQVKNFKHSFNIIDLIEVGDIVNGKLVIEKYQRPYDGQWQVDCGDVRYEGNDIKSILTHEMYEQNCYKVGDKE